MGDEWELARTRRDDRRASDGDGGSQGTAAFVGKVLSSGTNLAVGKFFLAQPTSVFGAEVEGGMAVLDTSATTIPVYLLGPGVPATGDYLVCRFVGNRWVAEKGSATKEPTGGGVGLPGCFCNIPATASLSISFGTPLGYGDDCNLGDLYQSTTLTYYPPGSAPAYVKETYPTIPDINGFFSPLLTIHYPGGSTSMYYQLKCQYNVFSVGYFAYIPAGQDGSYVYNGPGDLLDWILGGSSVGGDGSHHVNQCDPFLMTALANDGTSAGTFQSNKQFIACGGYAVLSG